MIRKVFVLLLVVMTLGGGISSTVNDVTMYSASETSTISSNARSILFNASVYDGGGNLYSGMIWSSLSAAQSFYGYDYIYKSCNVSYAGIRYNYYYSYSDSTRCFFRVSN